MYKIYHRGKKYYIAKMISKLDCPDTASKIYWSKTNTFLNKRKIPNQPPHLNGKLANGKFSKKQNYLINISRNNAPYFKIQAHYLF